MIARKLCIVEEDAMKAWFLFRKDARFLAHFAYGGLCQCLAALDAAAGQKPAR